MKASFAACVWILEYSSCRFGLVELVLGLVRPLDHVGFV